MIAKISEQLLNDFSQVALLDKYDVYEVLMEYWAETMQDDVYAVCYDGYEAGREIAYEYVTKKKKENGQTIEVKTDKIKGFEGKLLPKALIAAHFLRRMLRRWIFFGANWMRCLTSWKNWPKKMAVRTDCLLSWMI